MKYQNGFIYLMTSILLALSQTTFAEKAEQSCNCEGFENIEFIVDEADQIFEKAQAYDIGFDVEPDTVKVLELYTTLAEQGYAKVQWTLGQKYLEGDGVI